MYRTIIRQYETLYQSPIPPPRKREFPEVDRRKPGKDLEFPEFDPEKPGKDLEFPEFEDTKPDKRKPTTFNCSIDDILH